MSAVVDEPEMKAGHLPAEKVGGRRVPNKKNRRVSGGSDREPTSPESSEEILSEVGAERDLELPSKMELSYPTKAVRDTHEKPLPTHANVHTSQHNNSSSHMRTNNQVFQPRKTN